MTPINPNILIDQLRNIPGLVLDKSILDYELTTKKNIHSNQVLRKKKDFPSLFTHLQQLPRQENISIEKVFMYQLYYVN